VRVQNPHLGEVFICEQFSYFYDETGIDLNQVFRQIGYLDSLGTFHVYLIPVDPIYFYSAGERQRLVDLGCVGDVSVANSSLEMAVMRRSKAQWYDGINFFDSSFSILSLYRIVSVDSVEEVWSLQNIQANYDDFLFHPQFPGFFFAFVDGVFTQFNGYDGSIFQSTTVVPAGNREWGYPFADSIPRLIITNGTTLSFYRADISTPVNEIEPPSLPASFKLSQPYPNPFNPDVSFSLSLPLRDEILVEVFNILGQRIDVVYDGTASAGLLKLNWNAGVNPSGIYLIKAAGSSQVATTKAVLLK
jgi:hypothetical protein